MSGALSTDQIERAKAVDLVQLIGRHVRLTRRGNAFWGLCAFHKEKSPSFKVENGRRHYHCFGCGAHGDAVAWVMTTEGLSFPEAVRRLAGDEPHSAPVYHLPPPDPQAEERKAAATALRIRNALAIFDQADHIEHTPAWHYLGTRDVLGGLPSSYHHALRWHPKCPWESGTHGCMVGLFTDAQTGEPRAIHRTAITKEGAKVGRLSLGPTKGCVIRLWPTITHRLVIGEGIETCLSASRFEYAEGSVRPVHAGEPSIEILSPCWAAGWADNLARFPVLPDVPKIFILVDHDESQAGQDAALACAHRWHDAGRKVVRLMPIQIGYDFANAVSA